MSTRADIITSCNSILDACALTRNAREETFIGTALNFIAWVNDFAHEVKMHLEQRTPRTPRETPYCKVHDADDPIPTRVCGYQLPCPEHGVVKSVDRMVLDAVRKLATCEHSRVIEGGKHVEHCINCGSISIRGLGWTPPVHVISVKMLLESEKKS